MKNDGSFSFHAYSFIYDLEGDFENGLLGEIKGVGDVYFDGIGGKISDLPQLILGNTIAIKIFTKVADIAVSEGLKILVNSFIDKYKNVNKDTETHTKSNGDIYIKGDLVINVFVNEEFIGSIADINKDNITVEQYQEAIKDKIQAN